MPLPAFIVKHVIRAVFPRVSSSPVHHCSFFLPCFSFRTRHPRSPGFTISCYRHGKRRLRKILSTGKSSELTLERTELRFHFHVCTVLSAVQLPNDRVCPTRRVERDDLIAFYDLGYVYIFSIKIKKN
ncbi:hypothetical protein PUN28_017421 [Cardiocondyla obscurior]|uniref:Uncharacterized protein n=1 Tax=Cardiocondyla obscurior TaxID=286306 RepID=A0AAW2ELQ3_9HYME